MLRFPETDGKLQGKLSQIYLLCKPGGIPQPGAYGVHEKNSGICQTIQ